MEYVKKAGMPFYNLKMGEELFASAKKLSELFYERFGGLDIDFRLKKIRTLLLEKVAQRKAKDRKAYLKELQAVTTYIGTDKEIEQQVNERLQKKYGKLEMTIQQLGFVNLNKMYVQSLAHQNNDQWIKAISQATAETLKQRIMHYEDLAPMMYLR